MATEFCAGQKEKRPSLEHVRGNDAMCGAYRSHRRREFTARACFGILQHWREKKHVWYVNVGYIPRGQLHAVDVSLHTPPLRLAGGQQIPYMILQKERRKETNN